VSDEADWVVLGVVTRPHGVRGEVRVHPFNDDSELLAQLREVVALEEEGPAVVKMKARRGPKYFIARLEGVDTREAADALRGLELAIPREALPAPDEDEFYYVDAIGMPTVRGGETVGVWSTSSSTQASCASS